MADANAAVSMTHMPHHHPTGLGDVGSSRPRPKLNGIRVEQALRLDHRYGNEAESTLRVGIETAKR